VHRRSRIRLLSLSVSLLLGAAAMLAGAGLSSAAAAPLTWSQAVEIAAPEGTSANFELNGVACAAVDSCSAVGDYVNGELDHAAAASDTGGSWAGAVEVAAPVSTETAVLNSVACTAPGSCVAAGYYSYKEGGFYLPMIAVETAGKWAPAETVTLPANAAAPGASEEQSSTLQSVACSPAGACTAVGEYRLKTTRYLVGMTVTKGAGGWEATELTRPPDATSDPEDVLDSISCPAAGSCATTGTFSSETTSLYEPMVVTGEAGGAFATPVVLALPSGNRGAAGSRSISCPASGSCLTVGNYKNEGDESEAYVADSSSGTWGSASELPPPEGESEGGQFLGLACPATGACAAVGFYGKAIAASGSGTTWSPAGTIALPSGGDAEIESRLTSVSCPGEGSCVAVGDYETGISKPRQAMVTYGTGTTAKTPVTEPETKTTTKTTTPAASCTVTLSGTHLTVKTNGQTQVKLHDAGTATCSGKLTLTIKKLVRSKGKKHTVTETIGTASYSIAAGATRTVELKVNTAGRSRLHSDHGKLPATLEIVKSAPTPAATQRKSVELAAAKAKKG
jgi:hypothetical protein